MVIKMKNKGNINKKHKWRLRTLQNYDFMIVWTMSLIEIGGLKKKKNSQLVISKRILFC